MAPKDRSPDSNTRPIEAVPLETSAAFRRSARVTSTDVRRSVLPSLDGCEPAPKNVRTDTKLGKIVINTINSQGKLLSSYLVPKEHWIIFTELYITYHYKQEANAQIVWKGNQYKPFKYIDGAKGRFIFFNDTERNIDVKKDRFTEVQGVTDCDAFMFKLSDSDFFPKRAYAFGEPGKGHTIAMFSASEYDKKTNTLVALKLDNTRNKKVKLVWLQPE